MNDLLTRREGKREGGAAAAIVIATELPLRSPSLPPSPPSCIRPKEVVQSNSVNRDSVKRKSRLIGKFL